MEISNVSNPETQSHPFEPIHLVARRPHVYNGMVWCWQYLNEAKNPQNILTYLGKIHISSVSEYEDILWASLYYVLETISSKYNLADIFQIYSLPMAMQISVLMLSIKNWIN